MGHDFIAAAKSTEEIITYAVIFVLYIAWQIFKSWLEKKQQTPEGQSVLEQLPVEMQELFQPPQPVEQPTLGEDPNQAFQIQADKLAERYHRFMERVDQFIVSAKLMPSVFHLVHPLQEIFIPNIVARQKEIEDFKLRLGSSSFGSNNQKLESLRLYLRYYTAVFDKIEELKAARGHAQLKAVLADADKVAERCFQPILDFAQAHFRQYKIERPVCIFEGKTLHLNTLFEPTGMELIFLPREFLRDVTYWPAIAHEIGHIMYRTFPGMVNEFAQLFRGRPPDGLFWMSQQLTTRDIDNLISVWIEEIFCDVVGAMMLGPSYMLAQRAHFSTSDPKHIALIHDSGSAFDTHPPGHVRMFISYRILNLMGFSQPVRKLWKRWLTEHGGQVDEFYIPVMEGSYVAVPAQVFLEPLDELITEIYRHQFNALKGHQLIGIPGLGFTEAQHHNALRDVTQMLSGRSIAKLNAREMVAAVVYLADQGNIPQRQLAAVLRQSVIGIGVGEHAGTRTLDTGPDDMGRAVFEGLVLKEALSSGRHRL